MIEADNYFYQAVSDWHFRNAKRGPLRLPDLYKRVGRPSATIRLRKTSTAVCWTKSTPW